MASKKRNHSVDLIPQADPRAPLDSALLLSKAQGLLAELEADLLARARGSDMDLESLGEQLRQRKRQIMEGGEATASGEPATAMPQRRGRGKIGAMLSRNGKGRDARHRAS